jgi:hypothetical protein
VVVLVLVVAVAAGCDSAGVTGDDGAPDMVWSEQFGPPLITGPKTAVAVRGDEVFVGGTVFAEGEETNLASYREGAWHSLRISGIRGITQLEVGPEGTIHALAGDLLRSDGQTWERIPWGGYGFNHIAIDGQGEVYATGYSNSSSGVFGSGVWRLVGTNWDDLGGVPVVFAMTATPGGTLYVLGSDGRFSSAYYSAFDSETGWTRLTSEGPSGSGSSSGAVDNHGETLYVAEQNVVAWWNGTGWTRLGGPAGTVTAFHVGTDGTVYRGFRSSPRAFQVERWDGDRWVSLPPLTNDAPYAGATLATGTDGRLVAAGTFNRAGTAPATGVARWNGTQWEALPETSDGQGANDYVNRVAVDTDGQLFIKGSYTRVGDIKTEGIARWDGQSWTEIYEGFARISGDEAGRIYALGRFPSIDGAQELRIARWNGTSWEQFSAGIDGTVPTWLVRQGTAYVAGYVLSSEQKPSSHFVARWDGVRWTTLGDGLEDPDAPDWGNSPIRKIEALVVDAQGTLYMGWSANSRTTAGVARWDGQQWTQLGEPFTRPGHTAFMRDLVFFEGQLYAGGGFSRIGDRSISFLAVWDGTAWRPVDGAPNGGIRDLELIDGFLYVGGSFTAAGGRSIYNIARWDGMTWSGVGGGTNGLVYDLAPDGNGGLFIGGRFTQVGEVSSYNIAHWKRER